MQNRTQKLTLTALFCALAIAVSLLIQIPVVLFLSYDPKHIVTALCGLIMGPTPALAVAVVTGIIEMITVSNTGIIGLLMNVLSNVCFSCTAAIINQKRRTLKGAVIGLIAGWAGLVISMLLWNYIVTPGFMGYPRETVVAMLPTVFLPYNLVKGGLNAAVTFLLYRPVIGTLRKAKLLPQGGTEKKQTHVVVIGGAVVIVVTCVLVILSMNGTI